jgi:hypothetical protein
MEKRETPNYAEAFIGSKRALWRLLSVEKVLKLSREDWRPVNTREWQKSE